MKSLIAIGALLAAVLATPANAAVIYSDGPTNGTILALRITAGNVISDSFVPTASGLISNAQVGIWDITNDFLTSVQWSIGTSAGGSDLGSGTALTADTFLADASLSGFIVSNDTFSLPNISVLAGTTYYFTLTGAVSHLDQQVDWDVNDGPSSAGVVIGQTFSEPSDAFTLSDTAVTAVPESSTLAIFCTGLAGATVLRRRKRKHSNNNRSRLSIWRQPVLAT
jgi:hypothetical protein